MAIGTGGWLNEGVICWMRGAERPLIPMAPVENRPSFINSRRERSEDIEVGSGRLMRFRVIINENWVKKRAPGW
jgi:hypothetical protein